MVKTIFVLLVLSAVSYAQDVGHEAKNSTLSSASSQRELLIRYCIPCHNEKLKTAGLMLDKIDVEHVAEGAEVWEKVIRKLRTGAMPPAGMPRPSQGEYDSLAKYLETTIDKAAAARPNPGRPARVHRLNRTEYANAIRDLLALDIAADSLFPADDSGYGFDNIGDLLSISPMLVDRYMSAARLVTRLAIGDKTVQPSTKTYDVPAYTVQDHRGDENLPLGSRGGIAVQHYFPLNGEYLLKVRLQRILDSAGGYFLGLGERHQLDVWFDGIRIKQFLFGGESLKPEEVEAGLEIRFPAKPGRHIVGVAFANENLVSEEMVRPPFAKLYFEGMGLKSNGKLNPGVASLSISGPYNSTGTSETTSRRKIFICQPTTTEDETLCARKILANLALRAYRRSITDEDIERLLKLYRAGLDAGFEAGIGRALQGILLSREFLLRIEHDPADVPADNVYRINDTDLASRVSFFLWSSIPDAPLLKAAEDGSLRHRETIEMQVRRMLRDSRSKALVDNFFGQWLVLRSLRSALPNEDVFPDFDEDLRDALRREMELFLESMLREDRSIVELLNANYTFVNERLARHYGLPNIYGSRFRRVVQTDENRWGLLGKGSILTLSSLPNRTSPVLRGKWVLENILGTPPPPPPPNVPALQENGDSQSLTMRERMQRHRANPACSVCHARMDPLGFALENFDGIGRWRTAETKQIWNGYQSTITNVPIDNSGVLPDGMKFNGPAELRKILLSHSDQFVMTVTEKLMTYALGRGVEYYDEPAIREILREAAPSNYRWSAIILGIVKSVPFQMRIAEKPTAAANHLYKDSAVFDGVTR